MEIFSFLFLLITQWQVVRLTQNDGFSYTTGGNGCSIDAKNDTVWVVWSDNRNGRFQIFDKYSLDGGANWSTDRMIADSAICPSITVPYPNPQNRWRACVVWMDSSRYGNWEIFSQNAGSSMGWYYPGVRHTTDAGNSFYPSISSDSSYVLITWMDDRTGNWDIRYSVNDNYGYFNNWIRKDLQLTTNSGHSWVPQSAVKRQNFYVVWQDNRDGNFEVYFKKSTDAGTTWSQDIRLTNSPTQTYSPTISYTILGGQTILYVAYVEKGDCITSDDELYFIRSTDEGNSWSSPIQISDSKRNENQYNSVYPMLAAKLYRVFLVAQRQISEGTLGPQRWKIEFLHSGTAGQTWPYPWTNIAECGLDDSLVWAPSIAVDKAPNRHSIYLTWWRKLSSTNSEVYFAKDTTILIGVREGMTLSRKERTLLFASTPVLNGHLQFRYVLTFPSYVIAELYDCSGKKLSSLINKFQAPGEYNFRRLLNVSSGVYILVLKLDGNVLCQKLVFIKN